MANDITVRVVGGVDDPAEVEVAGFTNNIDKTCVKVSKSWVNANVTLEKTAEPADNQWKLLWSNLPTADVIGDKAVNFIYKVEETGIEMNNTSVANDFDTTYSEDGLTITNKYKHGTSVAVEKLWSDGKAHTGDTVEVTLYQSNIGPYGDGTPYTANVSVGSWQDTNGGSASAPASGSINVTFTAEGESEPAATVPLSSGSWSGTATGLKKGVRYTVTYEGDGTDVLGVGSAVVDGTNVTLTGVVPARTFEVTVAKDSSGYNNVTESITSSTAVVVVEFWTHVGNLIDDFELTSTSGVSIYKEKDGDYKQKFYISGISNDTTLNCIYGGNGLNQYYISTVSISGGSSGDSSSFTPADPSTLYQGNSSDYSIPEDDAQGHWQQVAISGVTNPVTLNSGDLAGKWFYEWAGLPASDANGDLYYYVKETGHTGSTEINGDPEYNFEFRDTEPKSITKVNHFEPGNENVDEPAEILSG